MGYGAGDEWDVGLPANHVARPRLTTKLSRAQVAIVEAAAGYGKSVLAAECRRALGVACVWVPLGPADDERAVLVSSLVRALRTAKLSDLYAGLAGADPDIWPDRFLDLLTGMEESVMVVFDDVHHLRSPAAASVVERLATGIPAPHRILMAGRRLGAALEGVRAIPGAISVGHDELVFDHGEIAQVAGGVIGRPPTQPEVRALAEVTGGWGAAVLLAARALLDDRSPEVAPGPRRSVARVIGTLLEATLEALTPPERAGLGQLAHLPHVTPGLAAAVTGQSGMLERLATAGVPLLRTAVGRWEMSGPVTSYLIAEGPLSPEVAELAAAAYQHDGDVVLALRVLLDADHAAQAAALLADLAPGDAEELGWAEIRAVVEALPEEVLNRHPRVLLHLARTAETARRMEVRRRALARAADVVDAGRPGDVIRREVEAERARDLVWDERTREEAKDMASGVLGAAGVDETVARARALDALGRLRTWWSGDGPHDDGEELFEESARLALRLHHPVWAAQALAPLAMGLHFALCRYDRALATIDRCLALLPARSPYGASVLSFRVTILNELGRFAESEAGIDQVRALAGNLGEEWLFAYASWAEAEMASLVGDRERTVRAVVDVHRHRGAWFDDTPGVEFLAQAADYLDRVGEHELAAEHLGKAREREVGFQRVVRVYEASVLGRSGDPVRAEEVMRATLARGDLDPQERWPLLLLRAYAAYRRHDPEAGALAATAFDACLALGIPEGPLRREPMAAEALIPLAVAAGSAAAASLSDATSQVSITLLGDFELRRGGRRVHPPAGRPAEAVRAVAAAGGRRHVEELIEILWPDSDPSVGRNRLRNLLSRLRAAVGDVLVREGEMVALLPGIDCDLERFEASVREAFQARATGDPLQAAAHARAAIDLYRGELLPDDRYQAWAAEPRERLRLRYLELLDLLADHAEESSDASEAVRLLQRAIDTEPYDEMRYVRLGATLASQGRAGSARAVVRRARAMLEDLGVDPSDDLVGLERSLYPTTSP